MSRPAPRPDPYGRTPPSGFPPGRRRLHEAPERTTRPVTPLGPRRRARSASSTALSGLHRRLVGLARVLAGGLVVLAVVVLLAPLVLGGPGPGADTLIAHVGAALLAVGATVVAAHRRTPVPAACVAALVVPVAVAVLLGTVWWS